MDINKLNEIADVVSNLNIDANEKAPDDIVSRNTVLTAGLAAGLGASLGAPKGKTLEGALLGAGVGAILSWAVLSDVQDKKSRGKPDNAAKIED